MNSIKLKAKKDIYAAQYVMISDNIVVPIEGELLQTITYDIYGNPTESNKYKVGIALENINKDCMGRIKCLI